MKQWACWLLALCLVPSTLSAQYFRQIGWLEADSSLYRLLQYPTLVEGIYRHNNAQMVWSDLQQSSKLEFQLEIIHRANFSPLFSRQLSYLQFYRKSNRWLEYDVLATDTLLLYLSYAENSKHKGKHWFFNNKTMNSLPLPVNDSLLAIYDAIANQSLDEVISAYTPDNPQYKYLIDTYLDLIKLHKLNPPIYRQTGVKKFGDKLSHRTVLLQRLEAVGINLSAVKTDLTWFDVTLENAIKQFQRLHGLKQDGIIGPATIRWLNVSIEQRLATVAINAERIRYWPEQRDTIILVNLPSFEMRYWAAGKEVFQSKVVVGRKGRPTPIMQTKLDSLILNPTWNVPWKIMVKDIIPKVQQDLNYLAKQKIKIIAKWGSDEVIDPQQIDWQNLNPSAFPYRMTQLAGHSNALGLYKFNTPNRRAIYLHDTPSKRLFNQPQRAFSSGCVRVENADLFATVLLQSQGLKLEPTDNLNTEIANQAIALKRRIPVHLIYQTAWYEKGNIHYREDIYRLDNKSRGKI